MYTRARISLLTRERKGKMKIHRSLKNVEGDLTVTDGDVKVRTLSKGFVAPDQNDVNRRVMPYDDGGVLAVTVENE